MKVGQVPGVSGVYNKQGVAKVESPKKPEGKKDEVSISNSGQDYATVMNTLRGVPDIRDEKVEEFSEKISNGTYDVSGKDIADKLVKSIIDKRA